MQLWSDRRGKVILIPIILLNLLIALMNDSYNQRGPLEYTFFRPFPRLVFGCINADFCVQGRIFQRFSSSPFFLCTIPDFSDFSGPLHNFSQNLTQFSPNFKRDSRFCKSLSNFHRISSEFHGISVILIGVMSKW